jgi:hypothetical protein
MSMPLSISLKPQVVNTNPQLIEAICSMDMARLMTLFESHKARPTDMIVDPVFNEPISLLDVRIFRARCLHSKT